MDIYYSPMDFSGKLQIDTLDSDYLFSTSEIFYLLQSQISPNSYGSYTNLYLCTENIYAFM